MGGSLPLGQVRAPGDHAGRRCLLGIMIAYHSVFGESNYAPSIYRKPSLQHLAAHTIFTSPVGSKPFAARAPSASRLVGDGLRGPAAPPARGHCLHGV